MTVGERIKQKRIEKGWTQDDLWRSPRYPADCRYFVANGNQFNQTNTVVTN